MVGTYGSLCWDKDNLDLNLLHLGSIFVASAIIPIRNNRIVLNKLIVEILEYGDKSKGARNTREKMIIQMLNQSPGSQIYL